MAVSVTLWAVVYVPATGDAVVTGLTLSTANETLLKARTTKQILHNTETIFFMLCFLL